MGQKTHPKGFRLVTTQKHLSKWYGDKLIYPSLIEEDFMIREKINYTFSEFLSIAKVEINRINQNIDNKEYVNVLFMHYSHVQKKCIEKLVNILQILWIILIQRRCHY